MRSLLYIFIIILLSGCSMSNSFSRTLDNAQDRLATDPEEAYRLLNDIDISEFNDSAEMARWALLYSEAMAANHISLPTDTIINIAVEYYSHHNLTEELSKARQLRTAVTTEHKNDCDTLMQALYIQKVREYSLYRERTTRELYTIIGITAILLFALIIMWQRQRIRVQRLLNENLITEASDLRSLLSVREADCRELEVNLERLLGQRFELIGKLCDTFYEAQGTRTERKAIAEQVKHEIESLKSDSKTMAEIEQSVNECRDNILAKLKTGLPAISDNDYQLFTLLACGFSNRAISMLTGETIEVIYKRKSRLRARIKNSDSPDTDIFLSVFH